MDELNQFRMPRDEQQRLLCLDTAAHLADWEDRLLHGQAVEPLAPQARQELADRILTVLTGTVHGYHPWYDREDAVDEVLARRPRINDVAWRALHGAGIGLVCLEVQPCLAHWQRLALHGLVEEDYFAHASTRVLLTEFAFQLMDWLTFPVYGYHPWYDAPDALSQALYSGPGGPCIRDEER